MCLIFLTCSLFLPIFVSHLVVCSSIDTPLEWFDPWTCFLPLSSLYTRVRVCTVMSCTSSLLVKFLMWEVIGWVASVVGSS